MRHPVITTEMKVPILFLKFLAYSNLPDPINTTSSSFSLQTTSAPPPSLPILKPDYSPCDLIEEAAALHCIGPLVDYAADLSNNVLHPPLSAVEMTCDKYNQYMMCTQGVRPDCRQSRAPNIEFMYETICEEKFAAIMKEEKRCLLEVENDKLVKECFVNKTNTLRDETPDTVTTPTQNYECTVIQAYVDCLIEREETTCRDAVKIEISFLSMLAKRNSEARCELNTDATKARPKAQPLEECDTQGNCKCRLPGYYYEAARKKCLDVDECESLSSECSQKCINLPGTFECSCDQRFYKLASDNRSCERIDQAPMWLFFAHGQSVWNISTDGKSFQLQRAGLQKTAMIDIDVKENRLYYADIGANVIERMNIEGTFPQAVQRFDVDGLEGIAVDWIGRNLYSLRRKDILVQSLDGRFRQSVYKNVMKLPRSIALHPAKGIMFVTDWSANAFIAAASMDGSHFRKIVTDRITWPNAVAVDIFAEKIYWADAFLDTIESCNMDGTARRIIIADAGSVPHVFGLAIADDFLYWTDWTYRGILRANKHNGENITVLAQTALLPYSLKIFHKTLQPDRKCYVYKKAKDFDHGRTRTCNPQIRSLVPYPLGHAATKFLLQKRRHVRVAGATSCVYWARTARRHVLVERVLTCKPTEKRADQTVRTRKSSVEELIRNAFPKSIFATVLLSVRIKQMS
uniref:EGF_CA domain-containing protein n=1 Tax=Caenorhabditis tropicalis TaxID=1561998 RepID=A0A1I7U5D7_9PELO